MFPIITYHGSREETKLLRRGGGDHTYRKKFHWKKQKIFFCKPVPIKTSENLDIKHLRWSKINLSKEKKIVEKVTLRISEAVAWRCSVKKKKV